MTTTADTKTLSPAEFLAVWEAELVEAEKAGVTLRIIRATTIVIRARQAVQGFRVIAR